MSNQTLQEIAFLYDSIRDTRAKIQPEYDSELTKAFDQHLSEVMNGLKSALKDNQSPSYQNANLSKAKFLLYELCLCKAIDYFRIIGSQNIADIFSTIRKANKDIILSLISISHYFQSLEQVQYSSEINHHTAQQFEQMKQNLQKAQKQTSSVLQAAESFQNHLKQIQEENKKTNQQYQEEKNQLLEENKQLKQENKRLLETLIRHSKGGAAVGAIAGIAALDTDLLLLHSVKSNGSQAHGKLTLQTQKPDQSNSQQLQLNQLNTASAIKAAAASSYHSRKLIKGLGLNGQIGPTSIRSLTLKQLKDLINQLYSNKVKYDQKCEENKLPRQTMQQYMYTYLNQRYGLKSLIIEWAAAIINGIRRYSKEDHDVALFGKILRNQCDQEFRFIQTQVKQALRNFLKLILKEKYIHKSETDVIRMIESIQNGFIQDYQWKKIINKMYQENDVVVLEQKFALVVQRRLQISGSKPILPPFSNDASESAEQRKLTRQEKLLLMSNKDDKRILFSEFQKVVLDFQLKEHEKFLRKFLLIFKTIDIDNNGIIDESEFKELVKKMGVGNSEEEINYYLQIVDPYNNNSMTFSEIVHLFSAHMVPDEIHANKQVPLLEKFSRDEFQQQFQKREEYDRMDY